MMRWIIRGGVIVVVCACDPLLPLRATSAVQPTDHVEVVVEDGAYTLTSGSSVTLSAHAYDAGGNLIDAKAKTVTWSVSDSAMLSLTPGEDPGTVYAVAAKAGTAVVTATVEGKAAETSVDVTPGPASVVALISGGSQVTVLGDPLPLPIVVEARDAWGNAKAGAGVQFTASNGSLATTVIYANSVGRVSVTYTPSTSGAFSLLARIPGNSAVSIPVTVSTLQLGIVTQPTAARSGLPISPAPVVQLQYSTNSAPYAKAGVTITASASGATLTGASAVTNASGTATFTNLVATGVAGPVTILFNASTYGVSVPASPTTLAGGLPAKMVITTQPPPSAVNGQPFSRTVVVQLQDAQSNSSATAGTSIQATAAGFALASNAALTDATGAATFSGLSVSGTLGQNFTLAFASSGLTGTTATARPLTGPASKLVVSQTPSTASCDATLFTPVAVRLLDASNNQVSQSGVQILTGISGGATIQAGATAATDLNGIATFTGLVVRGTASVTYPLTFTSAGLTLVASSVTAASGNAVSLAVLVQPPLTATNGVALTTNPQVRLVDVCGNTATASSASITASTTVGTVTMTNPTRSTLNGVATFSLLSMAGKAQNYTMQFSALGLGSADASTPVSLGTGAAAEIVLTTEPSTSVPSDVAFPAVPVARIRDVGGNQVVGARTVSASIAASTPANGTTVSAGSSATVAASDSTATFTGIKLKGIAGSYRLIFASTGLKPDTALITTTLSGAGTASKMVITTSPSTGALNSNPFPRVPEVQLQDANNNNVALPGIVITATQPGSAFSLFSNAVSTDATGKAAFSSMYFTTVATQPVTPSPFEFLAAGLTKVTAAAGTAQATTLSTLGTAVSVSGSAGSNHYFGQVVPAGKTQIVFTLSGSQSVNASLFVGRTDLPTSISTLCIQTQVNPSVKTCSVPNPAAGQYFVLVAGNVAFTGTTISALQTP